MALSYRKLSDNNKMRLAAAFLAAAILIIVLFSVFFIAHEADHDCTGDGCPVCALIQTCENNLRQLGGGTAASYAVGVLVFLTLAMPVLTAFATIALTPVSRKIRLNN